MSSIAPASPQRTRWSLAVALFAAVFGIATIVSGGRVIFGPEEARVAAGRYVPWVVGFNFLTGFAYVTAAAGVAWARPWAASIALGLAVAATLALAAFALHVASGGAFEPRTAAAMCFRSAAWWGIAAWCRRGPRPARP